MMSDEKIPLDPLNRCPFCGSSYDEERLRTLKRERQRHILHATCLGCARAMMFSVQRNEEHVACIGLFTDCDATDALRFLAAKPLTLDDVLAAYITLSTMTKTQNFIRAVDKTARIG